MLSGSTSMCKTRMRVEFALFAHPCDWPKACFLLDLQKGRAAQRQRKLDDGQPRHMASPATLATTLEGTRCGLGLYIDSDTAGLYSAVVGRFERPPKPESVHPFNQRSDLRFDHFG